MLAYALDVPYQLFFADPRLVTRYLNGSANEFQDRFIDFISFDSEGSRIYDLNTAFKKLNEIGQQKAVDYVVDLSENPKYTRMDSEQGE